MPPVQDGANTDQRTGPTIHHESDRIRTGTERRLAAGGFAILAACAALYMWLRGDATMLSIALGIIALGAAILALLWLLLTALESWSHRD